MTTGNKTIFLIFIILTIFVLFHSLYNLAHGSSYNLASASDWGCNQNSKLVANYINLVEPEFVLIPGDLSYEKSGKCFFDIIDPFASKTKIAIGNHDDIEDGSKKLKNEYLNFFNLEKSFYSFNFQNTHVLVLDTQLDPRNKEQFEFAKDDLQKTRENKKTDWILVMFHKPMYSSGLTHEDFKDFAKIYHPLFDEFNVNLVLQGHNHIYERSLPLNYFDEPKITEKIDQIKLEKTNKPDLKDNLKISYKKNEYDLFIDVIDSTKGTVFVTVGTGGRELHETEDKKPRFIATSYNDAPGFLNLEIKDEVIIGTYYSLENVKNYNDFNKLEIYDKFILTKGLPLIHEINYIY